MGITVDFDLRARFRPAEESSFMVAASQWPRQSAPGLAVGLLLVHLIFEYLRLHQIFPILGLLKVNTVMFAALLLLVVAQTVKGGLRLARQSWYFLGFLALAGITIGLATNQYYAYRFAYGLVLVLIGYFSITHFLLNERDLKRFLSLLVSIHVYLAFQGILGYAGSEFDAKGYTSTGEVGGSFLGDENDLALAMIMILPFAIYLFRQSRSLPGRLFWGGGSVAILLTIIFTFSRGGFVGFAGMMLYWVMTSQKRAKAIGILILAGTLVITIAPSQYWERVESIKDTDAGTALSRRNSWAAARRMFYSSPIWGVGGHNFGVLHADYAVEYSEEKRGTRWGRVSHSMYFDLLAEFGLLGVLLIGSVIVVNFLDLKEVIALHRMGRCPPSLGELTHCLQLSWAGFLVPAAFLSVLGYPHLYYLTGLTVVVHRLAVAEAEVMKVNAVVATGP